ncbi:MAG: DUF3301 domain-containing protein [Endozoicomonas sp.]
MDAILWMALLSLFVFYWFDTARAKETAVAHGRRACKEMKVQFLDDSVVRYRSAVRRGPSGQLTIERCFRFEFTLNGQSREQGYIRLLGQRLQLLELDYPHQSVPDQSNRSNITPLFLTTSYTEEPDALRPRTEKRPDC